MRLKRTHMCTDLNENHVGQTPVLAGWVQRKRDHGGLIFIDLRDRTGIIQLVFDSQKNPDLFGQAEKVRPEFVLAARGEVVLRSEETINPSLDTGKIEVIIDDLEVLNQSLVPPFNIEDNIATDENLRLKYRYLDLRRKEMQEILRLRHRALMETRKYLDDRGFWEVETPLLTRSTPEGARDYLVPSRITPGNFFALPQSPQLFKQLLMVSGMEKYFQVARCFRDEDLRADRQPEFTQRDMELSFCKEKDVMKEVEGLLQHLFKEVAGKEINPPFSVLTYDDAMERFGSDKPDTRFGMEIRDISDIAARCEFKVFRSTVEEKSGVVKGINVKSGGEFSRKELDDLTSLVQSWGTGGLAWMIMTEEGFKSPISKFFTPEELTEIIDKMECESGDLLLFVADRRDTALNVLGHLRNYLAFNLGIIPGEKDEFIWIVDFPLFSYDEEEQRYVTNHHPFTLPKEEDLPLIDEEPLKVRSCAYDLVYNGVEIAGGSLRIHNYQLQEKIFNLLNISPQEAQEKFDFLLQAFQYGAPPHGGIAFGFDRLLMLMSGEKSIRDVIPFPKTAAGNCLLTGAPAPVSPEQLEELHISIVSRENKSQTEKVQ